MSPLRAATWGASNKMALSAATVAAKPAVILICELAGRTLETPAKTALY
jgi:hypothetical protein